MNLRVVQEILGAFGHQAVMACSGADAIERLAVEAFDVVLLDIHMPGMTGLEVIERVRRGEAPQRDVPVIALTADVYSRRPAEYLALGFNGLAVPVAASEFAGLALGLTVQTTDFSHAGIVTDLIPRLQETASRISAALSMPA